MMQLACCVVNASWRSCGSASFSEAYRRVRCWRGCGFSWFTICIFFFSIVCFSCEAISPCERFFLQYYIYYLQISHLLLFNEKFYSHVGQASKCWFKLRIICEKLDCIVYNVLLCSWLHNARFDISNFMCILFWIQ